MSGFDKNAANYCPTCRKQTEEGSKNSAERYKENPIYGPIYGTNLKRPVSEIVNELRERMVSLRRGIQDFQFGYPQWKERTQHVEGLLTCGIIALYNTLEELQKFEQSQRAFEVSLEKMNGKS